MATFAGTPVPALSAEARLYKYVRLNGRWKYLRADYSEDRVIPHSVFLPKSSTATIIEGGHYYAYDPYSKSKWVPLHDDPQEAERLFKIARATAQLEQLQTQIAGLKSGAALPGAAPKVLTVGLALKKYLGDVWLQVEAGGKKKRTYETIEDIVAPFCKSVGLEKPVSSITREIALNYVSKLTRKNTNVACGKTTKQNVFIYVQQFLQANDLHIFKKGDCPKAPSGSSEDIRVYTDEEIKALFSVASHYHLMCWKTLLMSGLRETELTHLYKSDLRKTVDGWIIRIGAKQELDWTPKTHEERSVHIPAELAEELIAFAKTYMPESKLLFPTSPSTQGRYKGGNVNGKLLDALKADAKRAGLNPEDFWLHAFRSTYATTSLRNGMDIADCKRQLGHAPNSNTIWKYVQAARGAQMQAAVEKVWKKGG
jgi:integrase